jgi:formiminoglutamase
VPKLKQISVSTPHTDKNDPRLGHWLQNEDQSVSLKTVIIGFPSDEGVNRNGGRPGASEAPHAIRKQLYKMTPDAENHNSFVDLMEKSLDIGDLRITGKVEDDQQELGKVIGEYLQQDTVPIILGGGHETAFGHFLGYASAGLRTSIFNLVPFSTSSGTPEQLRRKIFSGRVTTSLRCPIPPEIYRREKRALPVS